MFPSAPWESTPREVNDSASAPPAKSVEPEWRNCANSPHQAATLFYLRLQGQALLEACRGRIGDMDEASMAEHLAGLAQIRDEAEFAARADGLAATFAFRFASMRLATEVLRHDMRDYRSIPLPGGSPCIGWDETAWRDEATAAAAAALAPRAFAQRAALVAALFEDAHLTEMEAPFRPGLGQGLFFARPLRYLAAALVGSDIPPDELRAVVWNLAKCCRARTVGECIGEDAEENDDSLEAEGEDARRQDKLEDGLGQR